MLRRTLVSSLVGLALEQMRQEPPERKPNYTLGDGEPCPMYSCKGVQTVSEVENCYCACTMPPCSNCLNTPLICTLCNWNEYEDEPRERP